jgi:hypothetical protein
MPEQISQSSRRDLVVRTSAETWVSEVADAYRHRRPFRLVDDGKLGIDPAAQTILSMGRQAGLSVRDWAAVLILLGVAGAGVWLIAAAFADPEPTSKLFLAVGGGVLFIFSGGFSAVKILTGDKPPTVVVSRAKEGHFEFAIDWR